MIGFHLKEKQAFATIATVAVAVAAVVVAVAVAVAVRCTICSSSFRLWSAVHNFSTSYPHGTLYLVCHNVGLHNMLRLRP